MKRDPWETTFTVLFYAGVALILVGLATVLAEHAAVAAVWAVAATASAVWLGGLYVARVNTDRLRAIAEAERRRAVDPPARRRTVAEVITEYRTGSRIGDAERDVVVGALHAHYAAGRLTGAELEDRLAAALAARTIADLSAAVRDLPSEVTGQ